VNDATIEAWVLINIGIFKQDPLSEIYFLMQTVILHTIIESKPTPQVPLSCTANNYQMAL
jgi:hypothetical protein